MEIIHFAMDNLSIKITLIISLFVILKHSINLPIVFFNSVRPVHIIYNVSERTIRTIVFHFSIVCIIEWVLPMLKR